MRKLLAAPILVAAILAAAPASAADVTIKLATLAPDGSPWHKRLVEMGHRWREATDGRVQLRIYPGGVQGDDPAMVRKMRINQLQGGSLTIAGLFDIDPAVNIFAVPLFFESYEEYSYVQQKLAPILEERILKEGFVVVHWGYGGWVHLFSKEPVRTLDDLKRVKMFVGAGDDNMVQIWKSNGFRPVALAMTDVLTGLQTGMIDGLPATPLAALSLQWFRRAPYMLDRGVAPLMGATVVSERAWKKISEADREVLLEIAGETERALAEEIPRKDREAVEEMSQRGLTVVEPERGGEDETWRATAERFATRMREGNVPDELYRMAVRYRDDFRRNRVGGGAN